jgi:mitochondrial inner membrane protease subunit 1
MLPTIRMDGDYILHDRISHRLSAWWSSFSSSSSSTSRRPNHVDNPYPSLKRGSLITYVSPVDRTRVVCKRLIGLPGDIVCINPNGAGLRQAYVKSEDGRWTLQDIENEPDTRYVVVPPNHFWTQGDNLNATLDSSTYGPVPFGLLIGQARAILSVCVVVVP